MRRLNYDFTSLENIFYEGIQHHKLNNRNCFAIKKELNSFFKDSICDQVYYTEQAVPMSNENGKPGKLCIMTVRFTF